MNIGLFTDTYLPQLSGVATSIEILKHKLEENGHAVYIFTTTDPRAISEKNIFRYESVPFLFFKERRIALTFFGPVVKKVRELKIDIIHTHTEFSMGMLGATAAKFLNLPLIHTYHTWYAKYLHYLWDGKLITEDTVRVLSKLFCERADTIIVPSETIREVLFEYGVNQPIQIIATGVPLSKPTEENIIADLRRQLAIKETDYVLLSVNRLAEEKNLLTLIKKTGALCQKAANIKLILVGDGPQRAELENYVHKHQLGERILFAGMVPHDEINKYYQLADLYVNLSLSETQGLTFVEAITNQLPVIAMDSEYLISLSEISPFGCLLSDSDDFGEAVMAIYNAETELDCNWHNLIDEVSADTFYERIFDVYNREIIYKQTNRWQKVIPSGKYYLSHTIANIKRPLSYTVKDLIGRSDDKK